MNRVPPFAGIFEHASVGLAILDADCRFRAANAAYSAALGVSPDALIGRHLGEFTHPDDRSRDLDNVARMAAGDLDHYEVEKRYLGLDGRVSWGRVAVSAVRDAERRLTSLIGIKLDITEERAKRQQREEDDTLRDLAGRVGRIGGWTVSLPDYAAHWSDVTASIFELAAGAMPSPEQAFEFYTPESRPVVERAFAACALDGTPFDLELRIVTAKQSHRWVRSIGQAHRDETGGIDRIQGAVQDITEQKALEAQFLRAQRLESVGVLAGGIAHDLNNVLTPILMSIDLLRMDETDEERLAIIAGVEASARRGAEMVRQVLTFARGAEVRRVTVQVRHLMREVEKIVRDTFPKNVTLRIDAPSGLWPVTGDATQLHQVIVNLCVNARDAMPDGGTLALSLGEVVLDEREAVRTPGAKAGPHVVVEVSDTGVGMDPAVLERIFDPFFTTKAPGKGTGLGLPTSSAIVKAHGGFITVRSAPGQGSTFRVHLPADTEGGTSPHETAAPRMPRGGGELILVVDDEPAVRAITRRTLERLGFRALVAGNGAEALSRFAEHRDEVALVLTDMMMPVMDGSTLIEMLARTDPKVRIIAASGVVQQLDDLGAQAGHANVRQFLRKPYSSETLVTAIRAAIDAR